MANNVVPMNQQVTPMQCDQGGCAIPPWGPFPPPYYGPQQPPWYPGANAGVTFSLEAPANVIRGHFWWNGASLQMFDGVAWVMIGGNGTLIPPGGGTTPSPVSTTTQVFSISQATAITQVANVWDVVNFTGTPQIDTLGAWSPQTKKYTPNKAGWYLIACRAYLTNVAGQNIGVGVVKNDSGAVNNNDIWVLAQTSNAISSPQVSWSQAMGLAQMNGSTDFVRMFSLSNASGAYPTPIPLFSAWILP